MPITRVRSSLALLLLSSLQGNSVTAIKLDGKSVRGKSFTVPSPDRKTKKCTFTFKAKAKDWSTECGK